MLSKLEASYNKAAAKIKEKAAEVRAEVAEALEEVRSQQGDGGAGHGGGAACPPSSSTTAAPASSSLRQQQVGQLPPDSRGLSLHLCGFDVSGVSIAGQETCLVLPRAKLALDIGRCPQPAVSQQTVLITHGHLDHVGGLAFHAASRALLGLPPPRYVVLPAYEERLRALLEAASALDGGPPLEYELTLLSQGQELELPSGFWCRPFATVHPVPSQGYILYSMRRKLKPELVGRSQEEVRELRLGGAEVTDTYQVPEVAFTGDTSGELFERDGGAAAADMFLAKLLIIECTFVDDSVSLETARERGHIHITDLVIHQSLFKNEAILLVHFSPRYRRADILAALDTNLPPSLRSKCIPLLNGFA